ncbi:MAG: Uncharacterized protein XD74_2274 [Actinobacteria bacterium 66_15]|nr:MAG: Uncharacterized protein XD74_2274 [Actinobacteria bacterium 66_15]
MPGNSGSSPRAWGTHILFRRAHVLHRFIPTCMGNALIRLQRRIRLTVHPHVHGERPPGEGPPARSCGSSPRAWGTRISRRRSGRGWRFIPTCMGNASAERRGFLPVSVHPHVHGERIGTAANIPEDSGSSPRAWGTQASSDGRSDPGRFIPTCMGNASCRPETPRARPVHPHVHGERVSKDAQGLQQHGSSPRAWGTREERTRHRAFFRFIPTCMGNAQHAKIHVARASVHPHVHGERIQMEFEIRESGGSSPRAWGTQSDERTNTDPVRFIPTCMGNAKRPL